MRGICDYARRNRWLLNLLPWRDKGSTAAAWTGHGIIACLESAPELAEGMRASGLPLVNVANRSFDGVVTIAPDQPAAGRMAADYFLQRGYRHLALACSDASPCNHSSMMAFRDAVAASGRMFHLITIAGGALDRAPFPMAVLAGSDADAVTLQNIALAAGVSIPEQLAILGPGDEPFWADLAPVPLSQIDADYQQLGHQAAAALESLMAGRGSDGTSAVVQPKCVITRRSSDCVAIPHREAAAAVTFIWAHFRESITPAHVAGEVGLTRQRLDAVLKMHLGRTLAGEIEHKRMEMAMSLLRQGQDKVRVIARLCGFSNSLSLNRAFRRTLGAAPQQWRQQHPHRQDRAPAVAI
ncbi:MAG: substrate-binding domain-containing protein [Planctomycetaceae bacterium]|nr:substrate-binding domain-containing protein [Planctomycetaceae bacterium]